MQLRTAADLEATIGLFRAYAASLDIDLAYQDFAGEMAQMPGFISWIGVTLGHRLYTITAWEDVENPKQLLQGGTHSKAMQSFFSTDFAEVGFSSVWIPHHINSMWIRCPACARKVRHDQLEGTCQCGQPLPEQLPYW